jgi:hypothetical protein
MRSTTDGERPLALILVATGEARWEQSGERGAAPHRVGRMIDHRHIRRRLLE